MMDNLVKKGGDTSGVQLLAVMWGADQGNTGGTSMRTATSFDTDYFTVGSTDLKQLICQKDCTVTIKALVANVGGSWTGVKKNASSWSTGTYLLGDGRVYSVPFVDKTTVDLKAGDYIAGCYQVASDRVNGGGCFLVYLAK